MSDTAKRVTIKLENTTNDEIKVTKFEYQDTNEPGDWFTENLLGVDGFKKIEPHQTWTCPDKRNLAHIKDDPMKMRVTFKKHIGGTTWGSDQTFTGSEFTCSDDSTHTAHIA
jgi:hypothetical protein